MIRSFLDRETEKVFEGKISFKLPKEIQRNALKKLMMINASNSLSDLLIPPGNRLEILKGDGGNRYSIRINRQWRICFNWYGGEVYDVEILDYH